MNGPRIGSLFSGYGGLSMAVEHVTGGQVAWHCDNDKAASKVLDQRWPGVPNLGDITTVDWSHVEPVDVIDGGSPCQDVSNAGRRLGMRPGTRSGLWAAMCDAVDILRPRLVIWENVYGTLSAGADSGLEPCAGCVGDPGDRVVLRALGRVVGDLSSLGYDAEWTTVRASDVGAPHQRERVFVLAFPQDERHERTRGAWGRWPGSEDGNCGDCHHDWRLHTAGRGCTARPLNHGGQYECWCERVAADAGRDPRSQDDAHIVAAAGSRRDAAADAAGRGRWRRSHHTLWQTEQRAAATRTGEVAWGKYEPAIRRWERLTRPVPHPATIGAKGGPQLSGVFDEWLMGIPGGWITDVPGISNNDALRLCGNGVVPQQAAAALIELLDRAGSERAA